MKKTLFTLILALFFISPEILRADNFSVGGIALSRPVYEGADENEVDILPLIDISFGKSLFLNTERGLGAYFLKNRVLELGGSLGYYESREEEDDDKLKGLGDIDAGIDARFFAKIHLNEFALFVQFRNDLSNKHDGTLFIFGAKYFNKPSRYTNWRIKSSFTFADDNYMRTYFGVSEAQAASSGLNQFKAGSGLKDFTSNWLFNLDLSRNWGLKGIMEYKFLLADAANSPLVTSKKQFSFGIGLIYKFSSRAFKLPKRAFNFPR